MSREPIIALIATLLLCVSAGAYQNPLTMPKWGMGAGVADPGLLRWMGKYYLYATKVTEDPGIRCWESTDLVNWTYKGFCTDNDPVFANGHAWSPGPFYYNGKFYLFVCGIDQKHKVFVADKPTGPFTCVNKDLIDVNTLDAAPLLDDDGQLYLFYAGWQGVGIQYRKCSSPVSADGPNQSLKACQFSADNNGNFWTEGPTLYKHDGTYYLAYCGNDWLKDSYQVQVAKGKTIGDLKPQKNNLLIAQPTGEWVATGCNWITRGPDLKSLWNVYHCRKFGGHERRLCLDSLYFDKDGDLRSNGPTWTQQPNPKLPDWHDDFAREEIGPMWSTSAGRWSISDRRCVCGSGRLDCKVPVKSNFAAEFNVRLLESQGSYGVSLRDGTQEAAVVIDATTKSVQLKNSDGKIIAKAALPGNFDLKVWHAILLERYDGRLNVYFDTMLKIDTPISISDGGFSLVAAKCTAAFGWCGFSNYGDGEKP